MITRFLSINRTLFLSPTTTITGSSFNFLTCHSTKLRHLTLSSCDWVTDDLLRPVLRKNASLISLDLSNCNNCTEGVLQMVSSMCPSISCLVLRGCSWVTGAGLDYFCQRHFRRKNDSVEEILKLMGAGLRTNIKEKKKSKYLGKDNFYHYIQNKQMKIKLSKKPNTKIHVFKKLDISKCNSIRDSNIKRIVEVFKDLEILKLAENNLITDESMKSVARNLKKLKTLSISCCASLTPAGLYTVSKHCPQLQHVTIGSTYHPPQVLRYLHKRGMMVTDKTKHSLDSQENTESALMEPDTVLVEEMEMEGWQDMGGWRGMDGC